MATKNTRIVGYLPQPYHDKLREYMQAESLTESAAIIKIVKQFFDSPQVPGAAEPDDAIAHLQADIAQLQQRLAVLEQAVISGRQFSKSKSRSPYRPSPQLVLPPQTAAELARRLGVSTGTLEAAHQKGEAYFQDWSRRMDPSKRTWHKRGELFHPESE